MDLGNVRMVERRKCSRFAGEARQLFRIGRERCRQDLDSDVAIERRVAGAVNLTHPTGTERTDDFVGAEALAG